MVKRLFFAVTDNVVVCAGKLAITETCLFSRWCLFYCSAPILKDLNDAPKQICPSHRKQAYRNTLHKQMSTAARETLRLSAVLIICCCNCEMFSKSRVVRMPLALTVVAKTENPLHCACLFFSVFAENWLDIRSWRSSTYSPCTITIIFCIATSMRSKTDVFRYFR